MAASEGADMLNFREDGAQSPKAFPAKPGDHPGPGMSDRRDEALGVMTITRAPVGRGASSRSLDLAGSAREQAYSFLVMVRGTGRIRHYGHEAALGEGDLVLINNAAPCGLWWDGPGEIILLHVPLRSLRLYLPSPEYFCGQPLDGSRGIGASAAKLVRTVLLQLDAGLDSDFRSRVARTLLDTLATSFSIVLDGALEGSPIICSRNARVRLYIERNLRNPDLKPASIAADLRLSPRYLRVIFAASKDTVSSYVLRRRLEECARDLVDPLCNHLSITEIAFGWGFNSGPHFTRSFRDRFHTAPRTYRQQAAGVT